MTTTTAALTLPPPRRKPRVREVPGAPLPIPSALPHPPCTHYQATYSQGRITVQDHRQAEALWQNGYFGHGPATGGGGRVRGRKKWKLVEAEGLKNGKWFKEAHEKARRRDGKGGVEKRGEEVVEEGGEETEENVVDMKEEEEEREEEMEEGEGITKIDEVKEESIDQEEKKEEEEEEEKIMNVKEDKEVEEKENEMEETRNSEMKETPYKDDKRGIEKKETETKEEEGDGENTNNKNTQLEDEEEGENTNNKNTQLEEERDRENTNNKNIKSEDKEERMNTNKKNIQLEDEEERDNTNNQTHEHPTEESEESDEEFTNNDEGEMEMQSESEESEPWRTALVLPTDRTAAKDTDNSHTYLSLLPEEALFLSYALGCLVLTYQDPPDSRMPGKRRLAEQHTHEMTIDEMWRVFIRDDPTFAVRYAAFHHFRTLGWVVKAGLKYGVDYVLYPVGPPFYHAQHAVKVHSVWADTLSLDHSLPGHAMTWTTTATTERLANHVNKTPVICFLLRPRSLTQPRLGLIDCLKELKVQEVVLARWNPADGSG